MPDGRTGSFSTAWFGTTLNGKAHRWSSEFRHDVHEATTFADPGNAKVKEHGAYDMAGTMEGFLPASPIVPVLAFTATTLAAFTLQSETGATYTFQGLISNLATEVSKVGGLNSFRCSFESSSTVYVSP